VFVALVAPALFLGYWELSLGLWACGALVLVVLWRDASSFLHRTDGMPGYLTLFAAALLAVLAFPHLLRSAARVAADYPVRLGVVGGFAVGVIFLYTQWRGSAAVATSRGAGLMRAAVRMEAFVRAGTRTPLAALAIALTVFGAVHLAFARELRDLPIAAARNFFGVVQVVAEEDEKGDVVLTLRHGRTVHGMQSLAPERRGEPNAYYVRDSGIGLALHRHPRRRAGLPVRIGVVGLGTGTLATYGRAGDSLRFYEINPAVVGLANARDGALFTYLRDTRAEVHTVPGDARLALERELRTGRPQGFDVLVLDAFSSGSIPVHLLTREAVALYLAHLEPDNGVLALHISNRYLDLRPLVAALAAELGLSHLVHHRDDPGEWSSTWAFLARRSDALPLPPDPIPDRLPAAWRDDYGNLVTMLRAPSATERPADTATALEAEAVAMDPAR
jgi:hypothetical protein